MFFRKSKKIRKLEREVLAWKDAYADLGQEHVKLLQDHSKTLEISIIGNRNHNEISKKIDSAERFMYAQLQEIKDLSESVNISIVGLLNNIIEKKGARIYNDEIHGIINPMVPNALSISEFRNQTITPKETPEPSVEVVNNNPTKKRNTRAEIGKVIKVKKTGDEGLITFIFRDKKPLSYEIVLNNKEKLTLKRNQFDVL